MITEDEYIKMEESITKFTPNIRGLVEPKKSKGLIVQKGRKKKLRIRNLVTNEMELIERKLDKDEYKSFAEISLRAGKCPLPLNLDVWDGLKCPFRCAYCFADYFRESLYTGFFDNPDEMGLRHINPEKAINRIKAILRKDKADVSGDVKKAILRGIPLRFGIRFEDFHNMEKRKGVSLKIMEFLHDIDYPFMINTKTDFLSEPNYIKCLGDNTAVHVTLISLKDKVCNNLERGAPSAKERMESMEGLAKVTRVVARIEPYMIGINSNPEDLKEYAGSLKDIGVKHVTWDTYSFSANNTTINRNFELAGFNWRRMLDMTSQWQPIGSVLMEGAMDIFRREGIKCSTFDFGCLPRNDHDICCCTDGIRGFDNYNSYNILTAGRFIIKRKKPTRFKDFVRWADEPLNNEIKEEVKKLWNLEENSWDLDYVQGMKVIGIDSDGMKIYQYQPDFDYRKSIKEVLLNV